MGRLNIRLSFRYIIFILMIVMPIAIWIGITQSQEQTTPAATGQGAPWTNLWLKNSSVLLQDGSAGKSLAYADFNSDGIQDLVMGSTSPEGSAIGMFSGNPKAIGSQSPAALAEMTRGKFVDPFRGGAIYSLNHSPDFLAAGDFNNDGRADIVSAARGGNKLYLLSGNGRGEFQSASETIIPGQLIAMTSFDFFERDGMQEIVAAFNGADGSSLLVYPSSERGLSSDKPLVFRMPSTITVLAAADIDGSGRSAIIAGAGNSIYAIRSEGAAPFIIADLGLPVLSLAAANFVFDREGLPEVAAVTSDGSVHILARNSIDRRIYTDQEKQLIQKQRRSMSGDAFVSFMKSLVQSQKSDTWSVVHHIYGATIPSGLSGESLLVPARLSGLSISDLALINHASGSIEILMNTEDGRKLGELSGEKQFANEAITRVRLNGSAGAAAILPMKLNVDSAQDFVLLTKSGGIEYLISAPLAVLTVQTTVDSIDDSDGLCSLREAIINANNDDQSGSTNCTPGAGADVIDVPAGTYTLQLTPFDDEFNLNGAVEVSGDLDILNDDLTINGAGAATTIIQAGPTPGSGIDRVFDANNFAGPGTAVDLSIVGVTIQHGQGFETVDGYFTPGGGIMFDGFDIGVAGPSGILTLTDCVVTANSAAGTGGGIMSIFGGVTLSGTTVSANSSIHGSGGGIHFDGSAFVTSGTLTLTNGTVSSNSTVDTTFGSGGGIRIGGGNGTTISGSTISGNTAATDGGGINIDNAPATVINNSSVLNNNALGNGGGIRSSAVNVLSNTPSTLQLTDTDVMLNDADSEVNGAGDGGGIYNFVGSITYTDGRLEDNTAENGAGLFNTQNSPTFPPASFTKIGGDVNDNFARNHGGGIFAQAGAVTLDGAVLRGNDANSDLTGTGDGGGLYNVNGVASFLNSSVGGLAANDHDNRAINGAGIAMVGTGSVLLDEFSDVTGNIATGNGGGIYITSGTVTLNATPVQSNSAANGGGIYRNNGTLVLNSPILIGGAAAQDANTATGNGGGIANIAGVLSLSTAVLQGNTAANGGAIFNSGNLTVAAAQLLNNSATSAGGAIQNSGTANISTSRFFGNTAPSASAIANTAGTTTAENNWWGCDDFPNTTGCPTTTGAVDSDPRIDLQFTANPGAVAPSGTSTLTADVNLNTDGATVGPLAVLEGLTVTFDGGPLGSVAPLTANITAGQAATTFTAGTTPGEALPTATLDNGTQATSVFIVDLNCAITPLVDVNDINTDHTVTLTLLNGTIPVSGATVDFDISAGPNTGDNGTDTTDVNGEATFTYTGDGGLGTDTIDGSGNAVFNSVSFPFACSATKDWVDVEASLAPATAVNQINTQHTVTVTVTLNGSAAQNAPVTFSVVAGPNTGDNANTTTNINGQATFTYTGDGGIGIDTIQASGAVTVSGIPVPFTATASKQWTDVAATLTPAIDANQINTQHTVTATVTQDGLPVQGIDVTFNITAGPNAGDTATDDTDASGQATFTYTGDSGIGIDTIEASGTVVVAGTPIPFTATATKEWVDIQITLSPPTDANPINTSHTVTATLTLNGTPQQNVDVNFAVSGVNNDTGTVITDINGQAAFTYTGDGGVGTDTIQATGNVLVGAVPVPFSGSATKEWTDVQCALTPPTDTNAVGTPHTVTVTLTNGGSPISGVLVNFNVTSGPNTGDNGSGSTDSNGQTSFTYTGDGGIGTDTIEASGTAIFNSVGFPFSCNATKDWVIVQATLTPAAATNPTNTQHTVTATVLLNGAPQTGVTVNFNVIAGPNSGDNGSGSTDSNGQVSFTYTGDGGTGTDTIEATGTLVAGAESFPFTATATKQWVNLSTALTPLTDVNQINTDHTVTFTVTIDGVPVQDIDVDFDVTAGPNTGDNGTDTTDANGQATFTYTGDGGLGTDTIEASGVVDVGGNDIPFNLAVSKEWVNIQAVVTPAFDANPLNTDHTVTATITLNGSPASGITVNFNVTSGPNTGENGSGSTDGNGQVTFTWTGDSGIGTDDLTASGVVNVNGVDVPFSGTAQKRWVTVESTLTPASDTNPINTQHTVTATVLLDGAPATGVTVNFEITAGPNTGDTGSVITDTNGQAAFTYLGDGGIGIDTIEASGNVDVGGVPIAFNSAATKEWVDIQCALAPLSDTNPTGTPHTVTATVTNGSNPLTGVLVDFAVTAGPNTGDNGSGTTDGSGQISFTYTGDGGFGTDTIQASGTAVINTLSFPFSCTASKQWVTSGATLTPLTAVNQVNTSHTVTATITQDGLPAAGVPVVFAVISGPNSGDTGNVITDTNGNASFTYTGDGGIGTDTIQASGNLIVNGEPIPFLATATKQWVNVAAALDPSADTNQINTPHTVTVTVTQDGAPVSGAAITFNVTAGPNTGDTGNGVTNSNGQATFTYTGDGGPGIDTIEATGVVVISTTSIPFSATATKEWIDLQCTLDPSAGASVPNQNYTLTMTLTVGGNPQQGVPVTFDVLSGPNTGDTGASVTDVNGMATFTYLGDGGSGTDTVQASGTFNSVPYSCTATVTWCLFCDEFEDDVLASDWLYQKGSWTETGGSLIGSNTKKALAIATPAFSGCSNCSVETAMQTSGGTFNRVWLLAWYQSRNESVELLMKEESDKWVFKQRSGGRVVAKGKASLPINPGVFYTARVVYDGTNFQVFIDGNPVLTVPAGAVPNGTVGFKAKGTTALFERIFVD